MFSHDFRGSSFIRSFGFLISHSVNEVKLKSYYPGAGVLALDLSKGEKSLIALPKVIDGAFGLFDSGFGL